MQRHPGLRWLAPLGVVCIAALAATGVFQASASSDSSLPHTTPAALVQAVQQAPSVSGFAGTVVTELSLGLPQLPAIGNVGDGTSFTSLLSGSHTLQVWYGGTDKQRIALLASMDETDLFRYGRDVWQWSSADHTAVHLRLPGHSTPRRAPLPVSGSAASLTPSALASQALAAIDPSTEVTMGGTHTVADRAAYDLILTPRSSDTKIGSVHISVDGDTKLPLAVQIYPRNSTAPAVDVSYTSIRFGRQASRNFVFTPPSSATVHTVTWSPGVLHATSGTGLFTSGADWSTVVGLRPPSSVLKELQDSRLLGALTSVSGTWGSGRLLDSALLSVLITQDGRVYLGAVDPADLYAVAGR